jgi:hypothetical protein
MRKIQQQQKHSVMVIRVGHTSGSIAFEGRVWPTSINVDNLYSCHLIFIIEIFLLEPIML